jgi:sigma-B regulation protein RsbU (phosphoserine phosphatase)
MESSTEQMQCMEVWGGSQLTARGVQMGGLEAWVYSKPYGAATHGGDVYYASSCATGRISRLLLADVSGHGKSVAATAADLRTLMRRFVNRLDQNEFVRLLNQQFAKLSTRGTFATAVIATFFSPTRRMMVCNAGHPRPLLYRAAEREWNFLSQYGPQPDAPRNIPLGIMALTEYEHSDVELQTGDLLLCYTDALIESYDADGEMLGEAGLLRIIRLLADENPQKLVESVLREITDRYPQNLSEDDVTILVVRANDRAVRYTFREKFSAFLRLAGAMVRGMNPRAERPPLPDLNVANIGGAIIPRLTRHWRARDAKKRP